MAEETKGNGIDEMMVNGDGEEHEEHDQAHEEAIIKGRSGRVTGIIFPPPDIRAIVDKTAAW
jgi:hypothetical protein